MKVLKVLGHRGGVPAKSPPLPPSDPPPILMHPWVRGPAVTIATPPPARRTPVARLDPLGRCGVQVQALAEERRSLETENVELYAKLKYVQTHGTESPGAGNRAAAAAKVRPGGPDTRSNARPSPPPPAAMAKV